LNKERIGLSIGKFAREKKQRERERERERVKSEEGRTRKRDVEREDYKQNAEIGSYLDILMDRQTCR